MQFELSLLLVVLPEHRGSSTQNLCRSRVSYSPSVLRKAALRRTKGDARQQWSMTKKHSLWSDRMKRSRWSLTT